MAPTNRIPEYENATLALLRDPRDGEVRVCLVDGYSNTVYLATRALHHSEFDEAYHYLANINSLSDAEVSEGVQKGYGLSDEDAAWLTDRALIPVID